MKNHRRWVSFKSFKYFLNVLKLIRQSLAQLKKQSLICGHRLWSAYHLNAAHCNIFATTCCTRLATLWHPQTCCNILQHGHQTCTTCCVQYSVAICFVGTLCLGFAYAMLCDWFKQLAPPFQSLTQSVENPKPIATWTETFSCIRSQVIVFASCCHRFVLLLAFQNIYHCNCFGFGFMALKWKMSYWVNKCPTSTDEYLGDNITSTHVVTKGN